ncbi:MAG: peptide chain release factor N(5)-glutamine methyltransferase [Bacteroidetes bacterium]|nr:peptide chain release factor N(5)-glutamine methyltransferase [Bacteroidota bacterium]MCH7770366.1 peptide chain release factor N(5)-glutamine methyltransferase [Bacteroidota bacterium]
MLTILGVITKSTEYLDRKGIESPRANAEILLANILNCKRLELYLMYDKPLRDSELNSYREYLKRRSNYEPIQYITGSVEFYTLELKVTPAVLIPRPETEILVEVIIDSVKKEDELFILDFGSGCGNISIALAENLPNVHVTGIDISKDAIMIANENLEKYQLNGRVNFVNGDILKFNVNDFLNYDIIVSNPPYVSQNDYLNVQKEIKNFEPKIAVTDFSDGYKYFVKIITLASEILKSGGKLFFEMGEGQSKKINELLVKNNYKKIYVFKDYQKIDRVISGVKS